MRLRDRDIILPLTSGSSPLGLSGAWFAIDDVLPSVRTIGFCYLSWTACMRRRPWCRSRRDDLEQLLYLGSILETMRIRVCLIDDAQLWLQRLGWHLGTPVCIFRRMPSSHSQCQITAHNLRLSRLVAWSCWNYWDHRGFALSAPRQHGTFRMNPRPQSMPSL